MAEPVITPVVAPASAPLSGPLTLPVHTPLTSLLGRPIASPDAEKDKEKPKEKPPVNDPFSVGGVSGAPQKKTPTGPISGIRSNKPSGIGKVPSKGAAGAAATDEEQAEDGKDKPVFEPVVAPVVMPTSPSEWSPTPKGRGVFGSIVGVWDRVCSVFTKPKE